MMENRFFTWVWRFNALAIALAITLVLALVAWEWTREWRKASFPTRTTEVIVAQPADTDTPAPVENSARFGSPNDVAKRGIYAMPRFVEQVYHNRGISKESGGNRVNYLIVDTNTQTKRWLFEHGTSRLITQVEPVWHTSPPGKRKFLGHVLHVIDTDTNGDERLSRNDRGALYFVPPEWTQPVPLVTDMRRMLMVKATGPATFDVIYGPDSQTTLRRFQLPDATVLFELDLTDAP